MPETLTLMQNIEHPRDTHPWKCSLHSYLRERGMTCPLLHCLLLCQSASPGLSTRLPHFFLGILYKSTLVGLGKYVWGQVAPAWVHFWLPLCMFVFLTASRGCSKVNKAESRSPDCLFAFGDMILGVSVSLCVGEQAGTTA